MEMNRVLVTGCAGFIGSHLCERLLSQGYEVLGIDCFTANYDRWIKERNLAGLRSHPHFIFRELNLLGCDLPHLLDGIEIVYHQAALPGVRTSWGRDFADYVDHNILVTQRLLEAIKASDSVKKVVYASSSSVYGNMSGPTDETRTTQPISPYGVTKLSGEQLCHLYAKNFGLPIVSLRYFTVFGPRQRPDMAFHKFIKAILEDQRLKIYGDGSQTRDFTFIDDAVAANLAALDAPKPGEAFNIGGRDRVKLLDVIRILEKHIGKKARFHHLPPQPGDPRHTCADIDKANAELGYSPLFDLELGLYLQIQDIKKLYNLP
jgi:UDP-glucuronate 4-epimerase